MSARILGLESDVGRKFANARQMLTQARRRFASAPADALYWAAASSLKMEEALELSRKNGEAKLAQLNGK